MKWMAIALLFLSPLAFAQNWSDDPVVDHLKQLEAGVIKAQEFMHWCEQDENRHLDKCDGVNADANLNSKYMSWEEAMKLGMEKQPEKKAPPSLGEVARQNRIQNLKKQYEPIVKEFCAKNTTLQICKYDVDTVALEAAKEQDAKQYGYSLTK